MDSGHIRTMRTTNIEIAPASASRQPCSRYTVLVRRWLLLLLLAVLPLQFASAAAASYCGHETGKARHFGHHEHKHQSAGKSKSASSLPDSGSPDSTGTGGDLDCEYCHLGAAHPLLQDFSQPRGVPNAVLTACEVPRFGSRDPDTLDRPNWASLA